MKDEMMAKIMDEVMKKMGGTDAPAQSMACEAPQGINEDLCGLTEYVGTAMGHTIGLVIANLDYSVHELLKIDPKYRSIGILADRTGAGPQIFAADEAVKESRCGNCRNCVDKCPAKAFLGVNWSRGMSREKIFIKEVCKKTQLERMKKATGIDVDLCRLCFAVCPYTQRYLNLKG